MRKTLFFLVSLFYISTFAQEFEAIDGNIYRVGDSILIGLNSGYKSYDDIQEYYTDNYSSGYRNVKSNIALKKYLIKSIGKGGEFAEKMYWDSEDILIRFGTKGFLGEDYYARMDYAIKSGEIVSRLPSKDDFLKYDKLNDSIAFAYFVKSTSIPTEKFSEEYLYRFMNDLYTNSREDEFEYHNSVSKAKNILNSILSNVDFSQNFSLYTTFYLDNYDFENKGFLIRAEDPKYKVANDANWPKYPSIYLIFPEFEKYRFVSIEPEFANSYIKRKKDKYGDIDRKVYARINYKIVDVDESKIEASDRYSGNLLFGKIISIELYEFENYYYNWIGTIK